MGPHRSICSSSRDFDALTFFGLKEDVYQKGIFGNIVDGSEIHLWDDN